MKNLGALIIVLALCAALLFSLPAMAESAGEEETEWTVMFYFCGSDLESRNGYATGNLEEIAQCRTYASAVNQIQRDLETPDTTPAGVNVVIETGGSYSWSADAVGMSVDAQKLQRWCYHPVEGEEERGSYELVGETPLASMAEPATLADFIRWSAENYPAKKYCLVLWDHGGGSKNGLFIDELFDRDSMYLYELNAALRDGGVNFETVLFEACLMANLETAWSIKDSAKWMVGSEELVAGTGTAVGAWLQQLYYTPQVDGRKLGRWICDMTWQKQALDGMQVVQDTMTFSEIDLAKIDALAVAYDNFLKQINDYYVSDPAKMRECQWVLDNAFEFGLDADDMIDIASVFNMSGVAGALDRELYTALMECLEEAVVYNVRGSARARAGGISTCRASEFTPEELDTYALSCPSFHYLALLDAINPSWTAPDWVFEMTERLPEIDTLEAYSIPVEKVLDESGTPGVIMNLQDSFGSLYLHAVLYRLDPVTKQTVRMGCMGCFPEEGKVLAMTEFWRWPTIDGVFCDAELVTDLHGGAEQLYNIPISNEGEIYMLRVGYDPNKDPKETVYGLWGGYEGDSTSFNRNVVQLASLAGLEYNLIYPIDGTEYSDKVLYQSSEPLTMYRSLDITYETLEPGTYYLDYWVEDIFMRHLPVGRAELLWDGSKVSMPAGSDWQGALTLRVSD